MLQRLKFTEHAAELLARAHIVDGHIFDPLHHPEGLCANGQSGAGGGGINQRICSALRAQQLSRCIVKRDLAGIAAIDRLEGVLR